MTLTIPAIILAESFLSFLGLGTQEPNASWGTLISQGAENFENRPWVMIVPGLFMAVTLFCFNFIGDGLRDALESEGPLNERDRAPSSQSKASTSDSHARTATCMR